MTTTIQTLQSLATSGQLIATEHGVYRPHDGATEWADCPATGDRWCGVSDYPATDCPADYDHLECDVSLHDSDTREELKVEDLGITDLAYHQAIIESLAAGYTGHVLVSGRTVYAA
jgi:hypothetical protein